MRKPHSVANTQVLIEEAPPIGTQVLYNIWQLLSLRTDVKWSTAMDSYCCTPMLVAKQVRKFGWMNLRIFQMTQDALPRSRLHCMVTPLSQYLWACLCILFVHGQGQVGIWLMNEFASISTPTKDMYGEVPNATHLSALAQNIPTYFKPQFHKLFFVKQSLVLMSPDYMCLRR